METMKYPNVSGGSNMAVSGATGGSHVDEVDSLFTNSCWPNSQNDFNIDTHKLILESNLGGDKLLIASPVGHHHHHHQQQQSDPDAGGGNNENNKNSMDVLDNLLLSSSAAHQQNLAELKPLPPFVGYTANLSINGIQGHHYHAIAQRIPEENNNTYSSYSEQNIVSSSTCNNAVSADSCGTNVDKMYGVDEVVKLSYADSVNNGADSVAAHVKTEIAEYDISSIEDIAAIIGSAIADTTVPNSSANDTEDPAGSRDSWMDLDAWIDGACVDQQQKNLVITQDGLSEFVIPQQVDYKLQQQHQQQQGTSTLQTLLTHGYMPLLQNRLQNGPPIVKQEVPSSTNYGNAELITTSSPPANVVSTTDNLMLTVNGRFLPQQYSVHGMNDDRIRSPDMLGQNYPHTTTTTTPSAPKKSRSRAQKKQQQQQQQQQTASSTVFQGGEQSLGLLGKEKPVHRCSICNRGFLNKSNIKVHLRTHTGEKPFRCETCAKAFRQKAHLLKHQQIHKRIGRD